MCPVAEWVVGIVAQGRAVFCHGRQSAYGIVGVGVGAAFPGEPPPLSGDGGLVAHGVVGVGVAVEDAVLVRVGEAYGESVFPVVLPCGPDAVREDFFRESAFVIVAVGDGLRVFRAVLASLCPADLYGCQSLQAVVGIDSLLSVRVGGAFSFSLCAPFVGHGLSVVSGDGCNPAGAVPSDAGRAEAVFDPGESVQGVVLHFHGGPVGVADACCLSCHGVGGNCLVPVPVFFPDGAPEGIVAEMFFHAEGVLAKVNFPLYDNSNPEISLVLPIYT